MSFLDLIVYLLLLKNIPFMKVVVGLSIYSPLKGRHLRSFQCSAVVNKTGMNIWVQVLCEYTFSTQYL